MKRFVYWELHAVESQLQEQIPGAVDMDEALWPQLTKEEETYI